MTDVYQNIFGKSGTARQWVTSDALNRVFGNGLKLAGAGVIVTGGLAEFVAQSFSMGLIGLAAGAGLYALGATATAAGVYDRRQTGPNQFRIGEVKFVQRLAHFLKPTNF